MAECIDCGAEVSDVGRRCRPCLRKGDAICAKHGVTKERRMKGGVGKWHCPACAREASRRSAEKAKANPINELVSPEVAPSIVGRDRRIFMLLCEELGVETVKRGSGDAYRLKDLQRIK